MILPNTASGSGALSYSTPGYKLCNAENPKQRRAFGVVAHLNVQQYLISLGITNATVKEDGGSGRDCQVIWWSNSSWHAIGLAP